MSGSRPCVVVVISNLEYGGAQRQVVELANGMDRDRFDLHVCSLSEYVPLAESLHDQSRLHILPKRRKFDLGLIGRLASLLRQMSASIVHGYLFDAVVAARLAGRLAGTPVVIGSERNADYELKRLQLLAYRLTRNCIDLIIANSQAGADFNRRVLGHDAAQYRVIHNGVDTVRFAPRPSGPLRTTLGLDEHDRVVGLFASFKEQKNHELFFRAAQQVLRRVPHARFMLVGDELHGGMHGSDGYKSRMMALVDELGIRERCVFLGNRDDVELLYGACDVTALTSRFEGTPNVLLESMACGVPVVATDVADNAIVAPDQRVGFIVPLDDVNRLADRLCTMLTDPTLRVRLATEARAWVEAEFSIARLVGKTADVYDEALRERRSPGAVTTSARAPLIGRTRSHAVDGG